MQAVGANRKAALKVRRRTASFVVSMVVCAIFCGMISISVAAAAPANEKTFASPGDAVLAVYNAAKSNDQEALNAIFGSDAQKILHTGDDVADSAMRADFIRRYEEMHRVVLEPDHTATLYIGSENWPFPIPLVKNASGSWYFDTGSGEQEILYRRVGRNENDAIEILHAMVDAQKDYAAASRDGAPAGQYAQKFLSDDGKHNGLYWKTSENEEPSPIGDLLAEASSEGYTAKQREPTPFHGYVFRMLTKQGAGAPGGAKNYLASGKQAGGFAFVAYPALYRNSGVMTFIVNKSGTIYEKDLGVKTAEIAAAMTDYNPDSSWDKVE